MASDARVCLFCGEPPGPGVFCAACGRNLSAVDRLPTRTEWAAGRAALAESGLAAEPPPTAERCAAATAAFVAAMHAAGDPGTTAFDVARRSVFGRTPKVNGWVVRPVDRDDEAKPRRYAPGLVLATDGTYHRLDSELRGFGQRDFPTYHHTVAEEPLRAPAESRLLDELDALLREHGVSGPAAAEGPAPT